MSGLRPPRVTWPAGVLAALGAGFFGIGRTTGSGWVVVLLCGVGGCLVTGTAWPLVSVCRARLSVTAPRDATAGRPLVLDLQVASGGPGLVVRPLDPEGDRVRADAPARGETLVTPARRGVLDVVEVEVGAGWPLGLIWWWRRLPVSLPVPMEVAPQPIPASTDDLARTGVGGASEALRGRPGHDSVRGVRPYLPGDPTRIVHWPATARWGELMVKELEDPDLPHLALVVDLRGAPAAAEETASRAAGLAGAALQQGVPVTLLTVEPKGGAVGPVGSAVEVGRRLARAVPGAPPDGPVPPGAAVMRLGGPGR